jgi:hypothetical protein
MATLWVLDKVFGKAFRKATPRLFVPAEGNAELIISASSSFIWSCKWITLDFALATYAAVLTPAVLLPDKKPGDAAIIATICLGAGSLVMASSAAIPFIAAFRVYRKYAAGSLKIINFNKK